MPDDVIMVDPVALQDVVSSLNPLRDRIRRYTDAIQKEVFSHTKDTESRGAAADAVRENNLKRWEAGELMYEVLDRVLAYIDSADTEFRAVDQGMEAQINSFGE